MARNLRDLRRKMKAIKSTRQVTKAMELVAASKMRRAVSNAEMLRRYALTSWRIIERIAAVHPGVHPFLAERKTENVLAVLFSSDSGFCGSLNAQMFAAVNRYIAGLSKIESYAKVDFVVAGRKGHQFLLRNKQNVIAAFPALSTRTTFKDVLPVSKLVTDSFFAGTYDHVVLLYTDFVSPLIQEPTLKVLLPFSKSVLKDMISGLGLRRRGRKNEVLPAELDVSEFTFEPSQEEVLKTILPQLTEIQVYQGVLEAAASEHSARMVAMRNATDNATDILDDLTLTYNQTRQAGITGELAELSASKAALDNN
jgi:F-type H+-transporting ATPase subunit gamma